MAPLLYLFCLVFGSSAAKFFYTYLKKNSFNVLVLLFRVRVDLVLSLDLIATAWIGDFILEGLF